MSKIRPYKKALDYSYTIGVFPTLELLTHKPGQTQMVFISNKASTNTGVIKIKSLCEQHNIPFIYSDTTVGKLAQADNAYVVGVFSKYFPDISDIANHVTLVNPDDSGNLGTICRTMLAFGFKDLAVIKPAVDIFNPKTIRASMGAIFQLNFSYFDRLEDYRKQFKHALYLFVTDSVKTFDTIEFSAPYSLVFGNEGAGLSRNAQAVGQKVAIPQSTAVDSLNLAVSAGIVLYKLRQV